MQKLNELKNLLEGADYATFWSTLDSDDLYADLIADVAGFEELMRVRIAATVSQAVREVDQAILESWLNLSGAEFEHFVGSVCGWSVDAGKVKVPINKDNEAKGTVVRENVKFDRECSRTDALYICTNNQQSFPASSRGRTSSPHEQRPHYDDTRRRPQLQARPLGLHGRREREQRSVQQRSSTGGRQDRPWAHSAGAHVNGTKTVGGRASAAACKHPEDALASLLLLPTAKCT